MRQHHDQAGLAQPLGLAGRDKGVDRDLRAVEKVAKLRLPDDELLRVFPAHAVLEAEHGQLAQRAVGNLDLALWSRRRRATVVSALLSGVGMGVVWGPDLGRRHVVQRDGDGFGGLVHKHDVAMRERAAAHVLARDAGRVVREQRGEHQHERAVGGPDRCMLPAYRMPWPSTISEPNASASAVAQSRPLPAAIALIRSWTWLSNTNMSPRARTDVSRVKGATLRGCGPRPSALLSRPFLSFALSSPAWLESLPLQQARVDLKVVRHGHRAVANLLELVGGHARGDAIDARLVVGQSGPFSFMAPRFTRLALDVRIVSPRPSARY